jgi:hypothetical protein
MLHHVFKQALCRTHAGSEMCMTYGNMGIYTLVTKIENGKVDVEHC